MEFLMNVLFFIAGVGVTFFGFLFVGMVLKIVEENEKK